jgi:hypothetical protein
MSMKTILAGAALGLVLASAASAQISSTLNACPPGTQYAEPTHVAKGAKTKMAATEGAGAANPKLAATEGAGAANPKLAATEGAGAANPKLASAEGAAMRLSNGVARMPDGTYCSPVQ